MDGSDESGHGAEAVDLLIALVVLGLTFGSLVAAGLTVAESAARAIGTAAGLTVVIALAGLTVVRVPFRTAMGLAETTVTDLRNDPWMGLGA